MGSLIAAPGDDPQPPTSHTPHADASGPGPTPPRDASPGALPRADGPAAEAAATKPPQPPPPTTRHQRATAAVDRWRAAMKTWMESDRSADVPTLEKAICAFCIDEILMLRPTADAR